MRIVVTFDTPYDGWDHPEHERQMATEVAAWKHDEPEMEYQIADALRRRGHEVFLLGVRDDLKYLVDSLADVRPDLVFNGVEAFHGAQPDDGLLELGVVTAGNPAQWARTLGRVALGDAEKSPFVQVTRGRRFRIRFDRRFPYELDGGARPAVRKLRIKVHPSSVRICVPACPRG